MKKSILKSVGIGLLVISAFLLGACKDNVAERGSYIDTYTLDAVDIRVKAYPGFNWVSWGVPLETDVEYEIYRDDGKEIYPTSDHYYIDYDIMNNVTYTYTIYTYVDNDGYMVVNDGSNDDGSNNYSTYYAIKGRSKSVSVKAIKPDYITDKGEFVKALDLVNYESGGNKKYVVSKSNLKFKVENGKLRVAFPTKAYLKYTLNLYRGNSYEVFGAGNMPNDTTDARRKDTTSLTASVNLTPNFYKMDSTYSGSFTISSAGAYQAVIAVNGFDGYETSYIVSDPITIEALDVKEATRIESANYIDDGKTIRISWRPAKDSNWVVWPADSYTVYLKGADYVYTDIEATVEEDTKYGDTIYYADYEVDDNTLEYDFYVVLSEDDKVENNAGNNNAKSRVVPPYGKLDWARAANAYAEFTDIDGTDIYNDAVLTIEVPDDNVTVGSIKYKVIDKNTDTDGYQYTDTNLYNDSELSTAAVVPVDYLKYAVTVKDVALGSKVLFIYTVKEAGKADFVDRITTGYMVDGNNDGDYDDDEDWYEESWASVKPVNIGGEFTFDFTNTDGDENKGTFTVLAADNQENNLSNFSNYKYEIYYARVLNEYSVNNIENITTAWTAVPVTVAWNATDTAYTGTSAEVTFTVDTPVYEADLDENGAKVIDHYEAQYVFKYVKTNKNAPAGAEGAVATKYVVQDMIKAK